MADPIQLIQPPPKLRQVRDVERHRIPCPYEPIGFAIMEVGVKWDRGNERSLEIDRNTELKCTTCQRHFGIGTRLQIVGVKLEGE